jgi:hypothetical protein
VIAQESASTPQWRTRMALFSRLLTTILRITIGKIGFVLHLTATGDPTAIFPMHSRPSDASVVPHLNAKVIWAAWRADVCEGGRPGHRHSRR